MELTERDIATAMSRISGRPVAEGDPNGGVTLTELQTFAKSVRRVKSETTGALLNKMFYASTPRHVLTVEEAITAALHHPQFGHDWQNLFIRALQGPQHRTASLSPRRLENSPRGPRQLPAIVPGMQQHATVGTATEVSFSSSRQRGESSLAVARQSHITSVVRSARESHDTRNELAAASFSSKTADFPSWSVHHQGEFNDPFDRLRVNQNGVSLHDARAAEAEQREQNLKKILPNESGAIVIPHSPRNMGRPVVIVDATAEKEKMKHAQQRQSELKRLLALGGTSVEKYLKNQLTLPTASPNSVTGDLAYQQTMSAIVEFLSTPRK